MDGLLVINKPAGPTSHDVVERVRRLLRERRIGHTGTLDPMAEGVLPLVLGRATRLARFLSGADKSYDATVKLGFSTNTYDAEGTASGDSSAGPWPSSDAVNAALEAFRGTFLQSPPIFSAKKIGGTRSYALARQAGGVADRPAAVPVTAHAIEVLGVDVDTVRLRVDCSAGFYVRSLAHDLGQRLGVGGHLAALVRTRSGDSTLAQAIGLEEAEGNRAHAEAALIPMGLMLPALSVAVLTADGVRRVGHGLDLSPGHIEEADQPIFDPIGPPEALAPVRLVDRDGRLLAIARRSETPGLLHPSIVLV